MVLDADSVRLDRECLAAAAMVFAPATDVPRERALLRSAVFSLLEEAGEGPFKREDVVSAISRHGQLPELRPALANELFGRLTHAGILKTSGEGDSLLYRLDDEFVRSCQDQKAKVQALMTQVAEDLFEEQRQAGLNIDIILNIMLVVIARLMHRFGKQYAYQIAGRADEPVVVGRPDLVAICSEVVGVHKGVGISREAMADAMSELFARREPQFASFVFTLTLSFFYMRLVGLTGGLEALSEGRFEGTQFLLDTNMVVALVLPESHHHSSMLELKEIAQVIKASLHFTESTLDEFRSVVNYHSRCLVKTYDEVPEELVDATRSVFLRAYRRRVAAGDRISAEDFLGSLADVRETLEGEHGLTVLDANVESQVPPDELRETRREIAHASTRVRHKKKGKYSLDHDAHVYHLVLAERATYGERAAWLLTLDTSLALAAASLQGPEAVPFCMTLDAFLQVMSPYARRDHRQTFEQIFVTLVQRALFPPDEVITLDDFRMFTDFDLSIRALPVEDIRRVIRKVKRALGSPSVREADRKKLAYAVQQALSDPTLEYRVALEREVALARKELVDAERKRDLADTKHDAEMATLRSELGAFREQYESEKVKVEAERRDQDRQLSERRAEVEELRRRLDRRAYTLRLLVGAVILLPLAVLPWVIPATWLGDLKRPEILKVAVSLVFCTVLAGIAVKKKGVSVMAWVVLVLELVAVGVTLLAELD